MSCNCNKISIHAPRGGSDILNVSVLELFQPISIHAPRGGSDLRFLPQ